MRVVVGAVLTLAGASALVFFTFVAYGRGPFLDGWAFTLGLAGLPLLSAFAQIMALVGTALVWSAVFRRRSPQPSHRHPLPRAEGPRLVYSRRQA